MKRRLMVTCYWLRRCVQAERPDVATNIAQNDLVSIWIALLGKPADEFCPLLFGAAHCYHLVALASQRFAAQIDIAHPLTYVLIAFALKQDLVDSFVDNAFYITQLHQLIGQQPQRPTYGSLWWRTTGQRDQVLFLRPAKVASARPLDCLGHASFLYSLLRTTLSHTLYGAGADSQGFLDAAIIPGWSLWALTSFQQNASMG